MIVHREIKNTRQDANPTTPIIGSLMKQLSVAFVACLLALFLVMPSVHAGTIPAPTINKVFYDATTISGGKVQRKKINGSIVRSTVYVTLKDKDGNVKATVSVTPTSGTTWTVKLPATVKVAEGDTVTAYQTLDGDTSDVVTRDAEQSMAGGYKDTLKMPVGEILIEQTNANLVSNDEQAEAIEMLKKANPDIANDFGSVVFSINGTDHAYYEVTYTDGSTSGKIEAPDLKIKTVTEKSAAPTIEKVQVTDEQIIVTLEKEAAPGTKFYFVKNFTDGEDKNFCGEGKCKVDKSTSEDKSQAVTVDGTKVTFPINNADLELGKDFGIIVKEPHKFRSCAISQPVITAPEKVAVRDPRKLTDADKQKIDKAIRDANTVNGKSKLPDGTGFIDTPTFIEFDKEGNVTIISPNDVEVDWDNEGKPIFQHNDDGSYKVKDGAKVTKFPAKDLVKNLKPQPPEIAVDINTGKVTITPPAYVNPGDDTDLASYTIIYKDASDAEKTVTLTRTVDANTGNTTWTSDGATVDANTGVVTLQIKDLAVGATITAKAKDNGGFEGDTTPLDSDPVSKTLETVEVVYDANGGMGNIDSQTINKGVNYTLLDNKFVAPDGKKFDSWQIGNTNYAPGTEIKADGDIVVNGKIVVKAIWKDKDPNDPNETPEPSNPNETPEPSNPNKTPEPSNPNETPEPSNPNKTPEPSNPNKTPEPSNPNKTPEPSNPNKPQDTDKVRIVAPQTGDVSILALCSPAILASVGMVALFRRRKEKR